MRDDLNLEIWNWVKPFGFPSSDGTHRTCWQCEHIRIARQFMRKCPLHPESHIWGDGETEFFELGRTTADGCSDYSLDVERKEKYAKPSGT